MSGKAYFSVSKARNILLFYWIWIYKRISNFYCIHMKKKNPCFFYFYDINKLFNLPKQQQTWLSQLLCNTLASLPASSINPLERVQNAAAQLVFNLLKFTLYHCSGLLTIQYWLELNSRPKTANGSTFHNIISLIKLFTSAELVWSAMFADLVPSLPLYTYKPFSTKVLHAYFYSILLLKMKTGYNYANHKVSIRFRSLIVFIFSLRSTIGLVKVFAPPKKAVIMTIIK